MGKMDFVARILYAVIGILIAYLIVRRLTGKNEKGFNSKFFKYIIVLLILAIGFELLIARMDPEPEIVTQTVEQLKVEPEIRRRIGSFVGYGYNRNEITAVSQLPATIDFTIFGSEAELRLSVSVDSSAGGLEVKEYKIDSVLQK